MSSTVISSSNFQPIFDAALIKYRGNTGVDPSQYPFFEKLQNCQSVDNIFELFQDRAKEFEDYRNGNHKLISYLKPVVQLLHTFSGVAGVVPLQPTNLIFSGVDVLLGAAIAVGASYDFLVDLFECVANFLGRLRIYSEIPFTPAMSDILIRIMVEVLSVLSLATKQIKQGRLKKFAKKLLRESDIEAVLQRLDRLTADEARMTVTQTLQVVHGLVTNMGVVMNDGKTSTSDIRQALITMQEMTNEINKIKRNQLQRDIRNWLSPPDPSKNHNTACETRRSESATWFTEGSTFDEWQSTGSLLWVHGKPGSGKSILCSSIVQEVKEKCNSGLALMGYYYFDFQDPTKQDIRGLLASLLAQLCAKSDSCYDILSELYSENDGGSHQPNNDSLTECLKKMIRLPRQPMIYIIVDALDECPNSSGHPKTERDKVLGFFENLLKSNLQNLRICVTSRTEADIRDVLERLTSHDVSLHDESGQKTAILDYINFVFQTDRKLQRYGLEDKRLVINTLSANADGMFLWVVLQLDVLRRCLPPALHDALKKLPKTLHETYERILLGIDEENQEDACRLLQCLAVAIRPFRVQELAAILAIRSDGRILLDHADWWQENPCEAVLSLCSSLVIVVGVDGSSIVQFSHSSVKEVLTSDRLAQAAPNLSQYHIDPLSAHTTLTQASLDALLHLGNSVDKNTIENFPFSVYAAQHWVDHWHGRFEGVSSNIQDAMERMFDIDNPSFATWCWVHDIDYPLKEHMLTPHPTLPEAVPLYYATLCGFREVIEHLLTTRPGDINARGGYHTTSLHAAVAKGNFEIAALLLEHGADVDTPDDDGEGALHIASREGHCDKVKFLLEHHADVNMEDKGGNTPLEYASSCGELEVVGILLGRGAIVDRRGKEGWTPLFGASRYGHLDVVRLLIQSGAAVDSRENGGWTPLYAASRYGHQGIVRLLLRSGAAVDSRENDGWTPLYAASRYGHQDIVWLLIQSGAAVDSSENHRRTPLYAASRYGHQDVVRSLVQNGATVDFSENLRRTPLHAASRFGHQDVVRFLIQSGAAVNSRENDGWTPLYAASRYGHQDVVRLLIRSGAAVDSSETHGETPLHAASRCGHQDVVRLLIQSGAAVESPQQDGRTPLLEASASGHLDVVRLLIQSGAAVDSRSNNGWTSLMYASQTGHLDITQELLNQNADANAQKADFWTSLHLASANGHLSIAALLIWCRAEIDKQTNAGKTPLNEASGEGHLEIVRLLLKNGSNPNAQDIAGWTPLHNAAHHGHLDIMKLLLESGADLGVRNGDDRTPSDVASSNGKLEVARFLIERVGGVDSWNDMSVAQLDLESQNPLRIVMLPSLAHGEHVGPPDKERESLHTACMEGDSGVVQSLLGRGADVNERDGNHETPLGMASRNGNLEVAKVLINSGASVDSRDKYGWTSLHRASRFGYLDIVRLLLDGGADVNAKTQRHWSPLYLASVNGRIEIVQLLLERGANVEMRCDQGRSPTDEAFRKGELEIAGILSQAGAL